MLKVYLDDIRVPKDSGYDSNHDWLIVRTYEEAKSIVLNHKPQSWSFDHDLGPGETVYDFIKFIIELDIENPTEGFITSTFSYNIHSANPVGSKNIEKLLENYIKHKFN
jgi:hypothetical protein